MAKIRLQADMQESSNGQHLVGNLIAFRVVIVVVRDYEVLKALQKLHAEEKENTAGQFEVIGARMYPPSCKQAYSSEAETTLLIETHCETSRYGTKAQHQCFLLQRQLNVHYCCDPGHCFYFRKVNRPGAFRGSQRTVFSQDSIETR